MAKLPFSQKIRALMKIKGLGNKDLTIILGVGTSYISEMLSGEHIPNAYVVKKIEKTFNTYFPIEDFER